MSDKLEKIGALWINTSQAGNEYLTGIIGGNKVIAFLNTKKTGKQPDWNVYPQKPRDELPPEDEEAPF